MLKEANRVHDAIQKNDWDELLRSMRNEMGMSNIQLRSDGHTYTLCTEESGVFAKVDTAKNWLETGLGYRTSDHWKRQAHKWKKARSQAAIGVTPKFIMGKEQKEHYDACQRILETYEEGLEMYEKLRADAEQVEAWIPRLEDLYRQNSYKHVGGLLLEEREQKARDSRRNMAAPLF